jgi:hypothetical protein
MWNVLKQWLSPEGAGSALPEQDYAFEWYDPGPENPFGIRVLDCRPMTWNLVSTTENAAVAESYLQLRAADGKELVDAVIPNSVRIPTSLHFPHNGARLEGIVFKADSMEVKWDIYIYDSVFLFARSWTGELRFRAWATVGETEIHITEIECSQTDRGLAAAHIYFLIGTHAMGRVLPHRVPCEPLAEPLTIASVSFALFGKLACYAAFDDITAIPITHPRSSQ